MKQNREVYQFRISFVLSSWQLAICN